MFPYLKTELIKLKILNSFEKSNYGGKEATQGEIREWGGKLYRKVGTKWNLIFNKKQSGHWTYGNSRFLPKDLPKEFHYTLPDVFYDTLEDIPRIQILKKGEGPEFDPETGIIKTFAASNSYGSQRTFIHELGHQLHFDKDIITDEKVDPTFKKIFDSFKEEFDSMPEKRKEAFKKQNYEETKAYFKNIYAKTSNIGGKYSDLMDTVCAITKGEYGFGHTKRYLNQDNNFYMELFAHGHEHYWVGNSLLGIYFPKSSKILISFFKDIFE